MPQSISDKIVYNIKKFGLLYTTELILKKLGIKKDISFSAILRY